MSSGRSIGFRFHLGDAIIIAALLISFDSQAQQVTNNATGDLQEIVVTAGKRSENLQEVPSSLTAISAEALANQGVNGFTGYMALVPSLADYSGGSEGHGAVILRALNTGYYQTSNTVGYYIDDIPFSATSPLSYGAVLTLDPDLTDIHDLEVLKGPQATLYGASTLGGLIKVVTNKPDLSSYSGEVRVDGSTVDGGGSGYGLMAIANLPIIVDQLGLRLSGFDRETPGYMTNTTLHTTDRGVNRKEGGRIALRWVPTDGLDIQVTAFLQNSDTTGWNYEYVNYPTLAPETGPYTYSSPMDPDFHTTYEIFNATMNYTAGSLGTLTNSTSYAKYRDREAEDYSLYAGFLNAYSPVPVPPQAAQLYEFGPTMSKLSEELRFVSTRIGGFEWLGGLFFTREQMNFPQGIINAIPPSQSPIPGAGGILLGVDSPSEYKEEAVFGNVTYHFTDALNLTLGGRYSHNDTEVTAYNSGFANSNLILGGTDSDRDFTYLVALSWQLMSGLNSYARIATSYRPGGPESAPQPGFTTFKPDSLTNYEVGLKGDWFQGRVRTNLAVYYMDWKDVQMAFLDNAVSITSNGGKATSKGIEFESQYLPLDHLTIALNTAYSDAVLDSVSPGVSAATGAVAGNSLPYTPKWAGSLTADYVLRLTDAMNGTLGATYRYQGRKWSDYPGDPLNTGIIIAPYHTVDLRTGISSDPYKVQFRIANLTNERGLDTAVIQRFTPDVPTGWAAIIAPRTFILSLDMSFGGSHNP
jgi:iron complex outermembrane receptor protein